MDLGSSGAEMGNVSARISFATITPTVETKVMNTTQFVEEVISLE